MNNYDVDTIDGLLNLLDKDIEDFDKSENAIFSDFGVTKDSVNSLHGNERNNLIDRWNIAHNRFKTNREKHFSMLDRTCHELRAEQPSLDQLKPEDIPTTLKFPRDLVLGRIRVKYDNFDETMTRTVPFPISKPIYISNNKDFSALHKVFLRLIYTLPLGKCVFRIFDPEYLGNSIADFNFSLASSKHIFPDGEILCKQQKMSDALDETIKYAQNLMQNVFTDEHRDWASYNRWRYSQQDCNRMLEYKVLAFFGMPYGFNQENFNRFSTLSNICERCGILLVFSYDKDLLNTMQQKSYSADKMVECLCKVIDRSVDVTQIINGLSRPINTKYLELTELEELYPDSHSLNRLLLAYKNKVEEHNKKMVINFSELINPERLYKGSSVRGLAVQIGEKCLDKTLLDFCINDETPHYIIGGATGSGKSNFLHILITSLCWKYSPQELSLYLMDFKMGTEFTLYSRAKLPHAELIAVTGNEVYDVEYGVSVLVHLEEEIRRRSKIFNEIEGCNDYRTYRKKIPDCKLPRILLIVDEFQVLLTGKGVMQRLLSLAKLGRSFGLHMIMATQTLRGLDFNALGTQFRGRIALKCSAEDSTMLLGGAIGNIAAAELKIPFGIMNVGSGNAIDNIKFSIPEAKSSAIIDAVKHMKANSRNDKEINVYIEQEIPKIPHDFIQESSKRIDIFMGVKCDYKAEKFKVSLYNQEDNNVVIVGRDNEETSVKRGILQSVIQSACSSKLLERVIYVGKDFNSIPSEVNGREIKRYAVLGDMIAENNLVDSEESFLLIIDNCNIYKELKATANFSQMKFNDDAAKLVDYFDNCNIYGSFVIAFYDTYQRLQTKGLFHNKVNAYAKRVAFGMSEKDMIALGGLTQAARDKMPDHRAIYMEEMKSVWFKPYELETGEENE